MEKGDEIPVILDHYRFSHTAVSVRTLSVRNRHGKG